MSNSKALVAPSILSADFLRLGEDLGRVANADYVHFDVMDGHYVPNLSFGPDILRAVRRGSDLPVDAHLMVGNVDDVFGSYLDAGADILCFHLEAARHALRIADEVHAAGRKAGAAINPGTAVSCLDALIEHLDLVLVMSVNPGFGGQRFIEATYEQVRKVRALAAAHGVSPIIEVDGGVSAANARALAAAGADMLVAGSAVFGAEDPAAAVEAIRLEAERGIADRSCAGHV